MALSGYEQRRLDEIERALHRPTTGSAVGDDGSTAAAAGEAIPAGDDACGPMVISGRVPRPFGIVVTDKVMDVRIG